MKKTNMQWINGLKKNMLIGVLALTATASVQAATITGYWRLGEDDVSAVAGNQVSNANGGTLGAVGLRYQSYNTTNPTYTTIPANPNNPSGSTLGVTFGSSGAPVLRQDAVTGYNYSDNFGMEIWVKTDSASQTGAIFFNGAYNASTGFGLYQNGSNYTAVFGDGTVGGLSIGSFAASTTAWTHLALVQDSLAFGGARFYVNGSLITTATPTGFIPTSSQSYEYLSIGALYNTAEPFNGSVDDARLFTFTSGTFNASTDLLYSTVPEPSAYVLMLLGLSALVLLRRKFVSTNA
jgi:hypothetical protein